MNVELGLALVLVLVLMVLWFAVPKSREVITAAVYCMAAVWLAFALFLGKR